MARLKIRANNGIMGKKPSNKIHLIVSVLNTILITTVLLKLYGVI